jgi:hypothetical protein
MAKVVGTSSIVLHRVKKTTSIGKSTRSRPKGKNAKRQFKKYRGQGK